MHSITDFFLCYYSFCFFQPNIDPNGQSCQCPRTKRGMILFEQNLIIFGHCAKGYNSLLPPGSLELGRTLVASSARIKAQRSHAHNNERKDLVLVQTKLMLCTYKEFRIMQGQLHRWTKNSTLKKSFQHLLKNFKNCIDYKDQEGEAKKLSLPRPF